MSTGPTPLSQIIAQETASVHELVDMINQKAIDYYNLRKRDITNGNLLNPPNIPPAPLPDTPYIYGVNDALLASEETANNLDYATVLIPMKYIDPDLPVSQPPATIVIDLAHPVMPGVYRSVGGNDHYLPENTKLEFPANSGHWFVRQTEIYLGVVWQQVS